VKRTLVLVEYFPPVVNGPAIRLGDLLKHFREDSYIILTPKINGKVSPVSNSRIDKSTILRCKYYFLPFPNWHRNINNYLSVLIRLFHFILIPYTIMKALFIIKKHHISNIFTTSGYGYYMVAAYYLEKITGKPLFIYMYDMWPNKEMYPSRIFRWIQSSYSEKILMRSKEIFVMSEALQVFYKTKYKVNSIVIPHSVDLKRYTIVLNENVDDELSNENYRKIVFTGLINEAQQDSILNLVDALKMPGMEKIVLILYTLSDVERLDTVGIKGKNVLRRYARPEDMPMIQKMADILFLPIAFKSSVPSIIKTGSPSKIAEYLAAGRPILVHAPKDCYLSDYAKRNGFAVVVNDPDPVKLRDSILGILNDSELQNRIVNRALAVSKIHDSPSVSQKMQRYMDS